MLNQMVGTKLETKLCFSGNLGQKVGDKLTKIEQICFSIECFTTKFFASFYWKMSKFVFWLVNGYSLSNPSISGTFLKFIIFLGS